MGKRKSRGRPSSPEEIALRAAQRRAAERHPKNWGVNVDAQALPANADVDVRREGKTVYASRLDVFDRFHGRGALTDPEHKAVRRLEADIIQHRGEGLGGQDGEVVDCSQGSLEMLTQKMVDAGARVEKVLGMLGVRSGRLLVELISPVWFENHPLENWRKTVQAVTGEVNDRAQTALIRHACADLAEAYRIIDKTPKAPVDRPYAKAVAGEQ